MRFKYCGSLAEAEVRVFERDRFHVCDWIRGDVDGASACRDASTGFGPRCGGDGLHVTGLRGGTGLGWGIGGILGGDAVFHIQPTLRIGRPG